MIRSERHPEPFQCDYRGSDVAFYSFELGREQALDGSVSRVRHGEREEWAFGSLGTLDATLDSLRSGQPTVSAMRAYADERRRLTGAIPEPTRVRRRRVFDVVGDSPDVERYLSGDPALWTRRAPMVRGGSRVVTLALRGSFMADASEGDFARSAARCAAAADALSDAGYGVRIIVLYASSMTADTASHSKRADVREAGALVTAHYLTAKEADEPLDVRRLVSWGCTGAFRALGFGWRARALGLAVALGGHATSLEGADLRRAAERFGAIPVEDAADAVQQATAPR